MRKIALLFICLTLFVSTATAQTVRFDTNAGSFNLLLNPTNNPDLQEHVDNFLGYVALGRYHFAGIHRDDDIDTQGNVQDDSDDENFVLQMGGFSAFPGSTAAFDQFFQGIERFDPLIVDADNDGNVDFATTGLSNTIGTVSLALSAGNPNSGTSDFFINLRDNSQDLVDEDDNTIFNNLDSQNFVPFALIESFSSLNPILALDQIDLSNQLNSSVFGTVPVVDENEFVVIQDVTIIDVPEDFSLINAIQRSLGIQETLAPSVVASASASTTGVPEPASFLLLSAATAVLGLSRRRR